MKLGLCAYGYHFVNKHTERTQQNYNGLFRHLNLVTFLKAVMSAGVYAFLCYHVKEYQQKFGDLEHDVHDYINIVKNTMSA